MSRCAALRRGWRPRAAIAVAVVSIAVLAGLAWGVLGDGGLAACDRLALDWIRAHTPPAAVSFLDAVSQVHRPRPILAATLVALAVLLWRRERAGALLLAAAVGGGATLNHLLKQAVQRPRPDDIGHWVAVTDFSFPSGHVANATLLYATLALLVARQLHSRPARAAVAAVAAVMVAAVAASRLVLGAHQPSDVLAGAALAIGWLALCVSMLQRRPS